MLWSNMSAADPFRTVIALVPPTLITEAIELNLAEEAHPRFSTLFKYAARSFLGVGAFVWFRLGESGLISGSKFYVTILAVVSVSALFRWIGTRSTPVIYTSTDERLSAEQGQVPMGIVIGAGSAITLSILFAAYGV
jgi:hypothetical protein